MLILYKSFWVLKAKWAQSAEEIKMTNQERTEELMFAEFRDGLIGIISAYQQGRPEGTAQGNMLYRDIRPPYDAEVVLHDAIFGETGVVRQLANLRSQICRLTEFDSIGVDSITRAIDEFSIYHVSPQEAQRRANIRHDCEDYARLFEISCGEAADLITNGISAYRQDMLPQMVRESNGRLALQELRRLAETPINAESIQERLAQRNNIRELYLYDTHEIYRQSLQKRGLQITQIRPDYGYKGK